jgi:hypothetical protein
LAGGGIEEAHYFGFVAYVRLDGCGCAALLLDRSYYFFGGLLVTEIVDANVESAGGGQASSGCSYAAAGAGDDQNWGVIGRHGELGSYSPVIWSPLLN